MATANDFKFTPPAVIVPPAVMLPVIDNVPVPIVVLPALPNDCRLLYKTVLFRVLPVRVPAAAVVDPADHVNPLPFHVRYVLAELGTVINAVVFEPV
jgi:hypothetical protein